MKKSLLALAALTAFAGAASAQSSVTLFGIVDLNARNVKNGSAGSIKSLSTDGNASSRLGLRGVEDLGGGMRAGFWIEGGLGADVGSQGGGNGGASATPANWNRRSTVSLMGGFGEIRLGRDYTPTFWNHTIFDPFGTNGVGSSTNIISPAPTVAPFGGAQTLVRANNSIGYFLPGGLGGLYGQVMVAAGENQNPGNKYIGFRAGYAAGPLNVAFAYGKTEAIGSMTGDMKAFNLGGSFNMGFMTLMAQYHSYEEGPIDPPRQLKKRDLTNWLVGGTVPMGQGALKFSYANTDRTLRTTINSVTADTERSATQMVLGYTYDLSKRTTLYTHFSRVKNDPGLVYTAGVGGPTAPAAGNFTSTGYEFGVRHSF
jgi:predicted porin